MSVTNPKEALVLMAKAPLAGQVKTRLIGALSAADAADLYAAFLSDTFAVMEEVADERESVRLVLYYTPAGEEEAFEKVEREGSLMLAQRGDSLGERLENCFVDLFEHGFDSVVIIGGDSPTLPAENLLRAFESLTDADEIVLGPAEDDGYYLIGMRKLHPRVLEDIPWSTNEVLAVTRRRIQEASLNLIELPLCSDVDTPEQLQRLRQQLKEQKELARFTRRCLKEIAKRSG
ncbi:MAG: TIGR04282 family arsenosugar biosynthesis glycosyltransferase [Acidobacteria bacterium]|nr:TIGR04282 family arsenosugar biosynthesis glycosyltransferase [Acidobacteriota bacterium]MBI3424972.1 TIGR04282 family arsenosugar biosynthesis glycosyltransferase [Acidobacteriota bacterium]